MLTLQNSWYEDGHHFVRWRPVSQGQLRAAKLSLGEQSHLQNYQPENSASQYQLPKSHFFNRAERESLFLAHDPIISSFLSKPGHNCPFNS